MSAIEIGGFVHRKTLDAAIGAAKTFWSDFDIATHYEVQNKLHGICLELSFQAFGIQAHWTAFADIVNAAVKLDENISKEAIYQIFELTGVCVK